MVNCETCGATLEIIENEYICSEGHIIKNRVEVSTEEASVPVGGAPNKLKIQTSFTTKYGEDYVDLLIFHALFNDIRNYLGIKSTKYFDIFTNFIKEGPGQTLEKSLLILPALGALTYYSKRVEMEAEGRPYLYLDYYRSMMSYPYQERRKAKFEALGINTKRPLVAPFCLSGFSLVPVSSVLKYLGESGIVLQKNRFGMRLTTFYDETGVLDEEVENNKACFRQDLRRDYQMFFCYLQRICDIFLLEITEHLEKKFRAYFYVLDLTQSIHIPEIDISLFLYIYIMNYKKDFDVQKAMANLENSGIKFHFSPPEEPVSTEPKTTSYSKEDLESYLRILISKITWVCSYNLKTKVGRLKTLLSCSKTANMLNSYWKRQNDKHKLVFVRNVWYIKKLMFLKRMKDMKNSSNAISNSTSD
ncbi:hypothetical protein [Encephalitozoon cuniculi GB-M1]|uniref:Uncharacterized protein n=1 Tax=Encephalitozoon cuniculi (strain GB-M1) TaxID=284813 RepID=Q8SV87_ENCCU|nr:uncharacterized protein ECU06_1240 [Encephalitozoon cuniculi GB-M1]CAD25484.1 hypothetical protein [Encephalitozoon cuniculi GB-M1]